MASNSGGPGLKVALAAVFAIAGLALVVWIWRSDSRLTPAQARIARGDGGEGRQPRTGRPTPGPATSDSGRTLRRSHPDDILRPSCRSKKPDAGDPGRAKRHARRAEQDAPLHAVGRARS